MQQKDKKMVNWNKKKNVKTSFDIVIYQYREGFLLQYSEDPNFPTFGLVEIPEGQKRETIVKETVEENFQNEGTRVLMLKEPIECQVSFFFNSKIKTKHYHHQEQTLYIQTCYIKILEYQQIRENPNNFQRGNLKKGLEEDWCQIPRQQHQMDDDSKTFSEAIIILIQKPDKIA